MGPKDNKNNLLKSLTSPTGRPPFEAFYIFILCGLIGYSIADLSILHFRPSMLPLKAPPEKPPTFSGFKSIGSNDYRSITQRNMFNDDGKIPPPLSAGEKKEDSFDGPPTKSRLPLTLLGTIVHLNPDRSIATISKSNTVESYRAGEEIEAMAVVTKIERRKVIFRNLATRKLEFIDIPDEGPAMSLKTPSARPPIDDGEVKKDGEFRFRISKDDLNKYTSDLGSILKQARMVPNIIPGSGGKIDGFRFVSIQPDSIFSKLGFKPGDTIKSVNDEAVTTPTQAMEMYQSLKSSERLNLSVNRDGRDEVFDYTIE